MDVELGLLGVGLIIWSTIGYPLLGTEILYTFILGLSCIILDIIIEYGKKVKNYHGD